MTTEQLKKCPFCGSNAKWSVKPGSWGYYPASHAIHCPACDIKCFESDEDEQAIDDHARLACKTESSRKWNTRPIEDDLRAKLAVAVEALGEVCKYGCGILCDEADGEHHSLCPQRIALEALNKIRGCE